MFVTGMLLFVGGRPPGGCPSPSAAGVRDRRRWGYRRVRGVGRMGALAIGLSAGVGRVVRAVPACGPRADARPRSAERRSRVLVTPPAWWWSFQATSRQARNADGPRIGSQTPVG